METGGVNNNNGEYKIIQQNGNGGTNGGVNGGGGLFEGEVVYYSAEVVRCVYGPAYAEPVEPVFVEHFETVEIPHCVYGPAYMDPIEPVMAEPVICVYGPGPAPEEEVHDEPEVIHQEQVICVYGPGPAPKPVVVVQEPIICVYGPGPAPEYEEVVIEEPVICVYGPGPAPEPEIVVQEPIICVYGPGPAPEPVPVQPVNPQPLETTYDDKGRVIKEVNKDTGEVTEYNYYRGGNTVDTITTKDSKGRVLSDTHYMSDGKLYYQDKYEYDANGNKISKTHITESGTRGNYTDFYGKDGKATLTVYDKDRDGTPDEVVLKDEGNLSKAPKQLSPNTTIKVKNPDGTPAGTFRYDSNGKLVEIKNSDGETIKPDSTTPTPVKPTPAPTPQPTPEPAPVKPKEKVELEKKLNDAVKFAADFKFTKNSIAQTASTVKDEKGNSIGVITYLYPSKDLSHTAEQFVEFHYDNKIDKDPTDPLFERIKYDDNGNILSKTTVRRDGYVEEASYSYDSKGNVTSAASSISQSNSQTMKFDGQTIKLTRSSDGSYTKTTTRKDGPFNTVETYDSSNRRTNQLYTYTDGHTMNISTYYNKDGSTGTITTIKDSKGKVTSENRSGRFDPRTEYTYRSDGSISSSKEYDANNNMLDETHYTKDGKIYYQELYTFNDNNQMTSHTHQVVNGGGTYNYTENFKNGKLDNKVTYYPSGETYKIETFDSKGNVKTTTEYDKDGNVKNTNDTVETKAEKAAASWANTILSVNRGKIKSAKVVGDTVVSVWNDYKEIQHFDENGNHSYTERTYNDGSFSAVTGKYGNSQNEAIQNIKVMLKKNGCKDVFERNGKVYGTDKTGKQCCYQVSSDGTVRTVSSRTTNLVKP